LGIDIFIDNYIYLDTDPEENLNIGALDRAKARVLAADQRVGAITVQDVTRTDDGQETFVGEPYAFPCADCTNVSTWTTPDREICYDRQVGTDSLGRAIFGSHVVTFQYYDCEDEAEAFERCEDPCSTYYAEVYGQWINHPGYLTLRRIEWDTPDGYDSEDQGWIPQEPNTVGPIFCRHSRTLHYYGKDISSPPVFSDIDDPNEYQDPDESTGQESGG